MAPTLSAVKARHDLYKQDESAPTGAPRALSDHAGSSPTPDSNAPLSNPTHRSPARGRAAKPSTPLEAHGKLRVSTALASPCAVPDLMVPPMCLVQLLPFLPVIMQSGAVLRLTSLSH